MGELLDLASAGEHILVERDRRPLAVLVPYEDALRLRESPDQAKARALAALDRLDAFAKRTLASHPDTRISRPRRASCATSARAATGTLDDGDRG